MTELTNALTSKGNLKTDVSKAIKNQAVAYFTDLGFDVMPNGRLAKTVATVEGNPVTINLDVAIGYNTDFSKKERTAKVVKATEPVDVPELF